MKPELCQDPEGRKGMMPTLAKCRGCGAFIRWATTQKNRKAIALNPEPDDKGSFVLEPPNDVVIHGDRLVAIALSRHRPAIAGERRYMPHFATCPDAVHWRTGAVQHAAARTLERHHR